MLGYIRKALWCAAGAAALSTGISHPVLARPNDPALPCSAFARIANGGWTVRAPVMLVVGGALYSPTVGTIFAPGATRNGIELSDVLDRECGSR